MENNETKEMLPCVLTEAELAKIAQELGQLQIDLDELKETRKHLVSAIALKSKIATEGQETREVECRWEPDKESLRMRLIRQDTFNEVRSRLMTEEERQGKLTL